MAILDKLIPEIESKAPNSLVTSHSNESALNPIGGLLLLEPLHPWYLGCMVLLECHESPSCGNQSARDVTKFCSVHMDTWYYRISVACVTLWNLNSFSSHLRLCGPLQSAFQGKVVYACTNIRQVAEEEEEEEGDTPHIDILHNASHLWLFGGLH